MARTTTKAGDPVAEAHATMAAASKSLVTAREAHDAATTTDARRKTRDRLAKARSDWNEARVAVMTAESRQSYDSPAAASDSDVS